ncbi:UDP-N-acetylmuramoyl-tripeptide--D-alanyl-D-alanine ligase [Cognatiluteimonas weifangensis]|uniref:UDP-N-acetylmuramoyl-tripeptide--D-alanyl-D-alanine ligase n=1 Tax=Cognatiluteimonas weifangensis TaxID=2303539 RepID=A0A372DLW6_9GAMM|nr:UDP-N-acetylmuramoyl-tripeptide--D-alanyl-D-alanine ligase [Luteimonas weifangensis]RFP60499.1 UDP-N-acetylmuramoyl-tripeptide--D-alanyl-D-alanine ligase [Luteimonas weifangensis]
MTPLPLSRIAQWTGGRLHGADVLIDAVASDSRTLDASDGRAALFVALQGEHFDGHDHVAAAQQAGARAALVTHAVEAALPQVVVADTQRALGAFAAALQRTRSTKVAAITGSNGKTSVKTLLLPILQRATLLGEQGAYANPGNRNNEIGLPLAVLDAPEQAQFAIYEMGAGKPGDIAYLTAIARPDAALVNNIAPAHLERMGSLLGVADTKAAIYDALPPDGVAVINADDAFAPYFAERAHGRRLIRFGLDASADVTAREVTLDAAGARFVLCTPQGEVDVVLALSGRHNVRNALAAASLALGLGASLQAIAEGLAAARPVAGRLVRHRLAGGAELIDDSYNANPGSLNAAIDLLAADTASSGGEAWLVLGDMRELGADAHALHAEAGRRARAAGLARLYALGPLSAAAAAAFGPGARHFETHAALAQALRADLAAAAPAAAPAVLVKGSRGSAMDRIARALLDEGTGNAA